MSLRPVDLATLLPRAAEAARLQQAAQTQPNASQQEFAATFKVEVTNRLSQVQEADPSTGEHREVNLEERAAGGQGQGAGAGGGGQPKEGSEPQAEPIKEPGLGQRLDIRI